MIKIQKTQSYTPDMVGCIHYSSYWRTYSLILEVNGSVITELDSFGEINNGDDHNIRTHRTALSAGDKIMTTNEFYHQHIALKEGNK